MPSPYSTVPLHDDEARALVSLHGSPSLASSLADPAAPPRACRAYLLCPAAVFASLLLFVLYLSPRVDRGAGADRSRAGAPPSPLSGPACARLNASAPRLLAFDPYLPAPPPRLDAALSQPRLAAQDRFAFNAVRIAQGLGRALYGPFVTASGRFSSRPPYPARARHLVAFYNSSRVFRYFDAACFVVDPAVLKRVCNPDNSVLACASLDRCRASPLVTAIGGANARLRTVQLPSRDSRLVAFAYRNKPMQEATCLLVAGYDAGSAAESQSSLEFMSTNPHARLDELFLPNNALSKLQKTASATVVQAARKLFHSTPWLMWKRIADRHKEDLLAESVGTRSTFGAVVFDTPWNHIVGKCGKGEFSTALKVGVKEFVGTDQVAVLHGTMFASRKDGLDDLKQEFGRGKHSDAVNVLTGSPPTNNLLNQLLAMEAVAVARDCVHIVASVKEKTDVFDVLRLERFAAPCHKIVVSPATYNCSVTHSRHSS